MSDPSSRPPSAAAGATDPAAGLLARLDALNKVGIALSAERNMTALMELILESAKRITRADGGTLYALRDDGQLHFVLVRTDSLGLFLDERNGLPEPFVGPIPLYDGAGKPNNSTVAAWCVLQDRTVNIEDAYTSELFDFSGTRAFDERTGYRSRSFLTIPLKNHENTIIGVLQLINAQAPETGEIVPFTAADQQLAESLASQAAIALTNRQLLEQHERLLTAVIEVINTAIDQKSSYTGNHCQRVPELTMMLAEAAHTTLAGPLAAFQMTDADRYELRVAGLLHDCGKITTPVHIVDKSTKLECIFDRIHLIDSRFEILKREAKIAFLEARLANSDAAAIAAAQQHFEAQLRQLEDDKVFLHHCNIGSEAMSDEDQARIERIARHLYTDAEGRPANFLTEDEVYNLSVRRGTLNAEDRAIINEHIVATIRMLETLPWPKHLSRVPEYAGGHHERVDGKGYPKGLKGEEMSWPARMMAIADIFEALTAKDRPYKPGKKLSEALAILGRMKLDGHIDPDLFDLFIRDKVYLPYALRFLDEDQIDTVDETQLPGYAAS